MHDGVLLVLTHRLQWGVPPSHFWNDRRKEIHGRGSESQLTTLRALQRGQKVRLERAVSGVEDGPTGNTSRKPGHERKWSREGRGDPESGMVIMTDIDRMFSHIFSLVRT